MNLLLISIIVISAFVIITITPFVFGDEEWKVYKLTHAPMHPEDRVFKILYKITNATIESIQVQDYGNIEIKIKSYDSGKLEITIPKNLHYTQGQGVPPETSSFVIVDGVETGTHAESRCTVTYDIPFLKNSKMIELPITTSGSSPIHPFAIPEDCFEEVLIQDVLSPRQQIAKGIQLERVICKEGLQLIFKSKDNSPSCVKLETIEKLVERGWGSTTVQNIQKTWVEIKDTQCADPWDHSSKVYAEEWKRNHPDSINPNIREYIITRYYQDRGITIYDKKSVEGIYPAQTCEGCSCGDGHAWFFLVLNSDVDKMIKTGFKVSENQEPEIHENTETENQITDTGDFSCSGSAACFQGTINRIIDGDTLEINGITIRLALTSTPELGTEIGNKAKEFLTINCPVGSKVVVDEDDLQTKGSYGRMLAKVYCERGMLNDQLLGNNLATIDKRFCSKSEFSGEDWAKKYGC